MQARFGSRTADLVCMGGIAFCALVLLCSESVMEAYTSMTAGHPFFMGFCKFALLATLGECLALRLTKGVYMTAGFGLIPRALVWGCLGVRRSRSLSRRWPSSAAASSSPRWRRARSKAYLHQKSGPQCGPLFLIPIQIFAFFSSRFKRQTASVRTSRMLTSARRA